MPRQASRPHVKQNKQLAELLVLMKQERDARNEQEKKIEEWVNNAVEKNALNNGTLTFSNFSNMLKEQRELINAELLNQKEDIDKKLDSLLSSLTGRHSGFIEIENNNTQANTAFNTEDMIRRNFHFWNGKYCLADIYFSFYLNRHQTGKAALLLHVCKMNVCITSFT